METLSFIRISANIYEKMQYWVSLQSRSDFITGNISPCAPLGIDPLRGAPLNVPVITSLSRLGYSPHLIQNSFFVYNIDLFDGQTHLLHLHRPDTSTNRRHTPATA